MKKLNKTIISSSLDYGLLFLVLTFGPISLPSHTGILKNPDILAPHGTCELSQGLTVWGNFLFLKDKWSWERV